MDSEDYYDSLDEDLNCGNLKPTKKCLTNGKLKKTRKVSKIPITAATHQHEKDTNVNSTTQEDDIVPFYDQNLSKSEVELKKMYSKYGSDLDIPKNPTKKKISRKRSIIPRVNGKLKSNSYLDMFYAKAGVDKVDLTNRATCIDLSPRSYTTCDDFGPSSVELSEIESLYVRENINSMEDISLSLTSLDSNLCSVSQQHLKIKPVTIKSKKPYTKPIGKFVPELGRLGPEIPLEKLDLLKKRQEYGQKASQKNKIKMVEKKLLQNLQHEIKECKKIV